jgi:hypothetical protein
MRQELDAKRKHVVEKMMAIRSLRRGTLNEQFVERLNEGKGTGELRGPYYVLSRHDNGKTVSARVRGDQAQSVRDDLARFKEFTLLYEEFARLTEQLGELERQQAASEEAEKKGLKSRPNGRRR